MTTIQFAREFTSCGHVQLLDEDVPSTQVDEQQAVTFKWTGFCSGCIEDSITEFLYAKFHQLIPSYGNIEITMANLTSASLGVREILREVEEECDEMMAERAPVPLDEDEAPLASHNEETKKKIRDFFKYLNELCEAIDQAFRDEAIRAIRHDWESILDVSAGFDDL